MVLERCRLHVIQGSWSMQSIRDLEESLPIRHNLFLIYVLSLIIAVLMTVASVTSLVLRETIYPTEALFDAFVPNDLINLGVGVPVLLAMMWLTRRGKLIGLLCWPGALFFVVYNYIAYVFAVPLSAVFLLHLALLTLSAYTLIILCASIDAARVQMLLRPAVPAGFSAAVLVLLGALFFFRVVGVVIGSLGSQTPLTGSELAVNIADFLITPAWVLGGILLWQKKPLGYVTSLGLLFQASILFISLILLMILQPIMTNAPLLLADIGIVLAMGTVCFIPFVLFARGVLSK
ncbi:hypothetical protein EG833_04580 [archaeon]|nr:hypothetical protein [archaeon]